MLSSFSPAALRGTCGGGAKSIFSLMSWGVRRKGGVLGPSSVRLGEEVFKYYPHMTTSKPKRGSTLTLLKGIEKKTWVKGEKKNTINGQEKINDMPGCRRTRGCREVYIIYISKSERKREGRNSQTGKKIPWLGHRRLEPINLGEPCTPVHWLAPGGQNRHRMCIFAIINGEKKSQVGGWGGLYRRGWNLRKGS